MRSMVEGTSMLHGPQSTVKKARRLRRVMTIPEVILWTRLRQRPGGFKFRRQHPAGPYVLDFFCSEARLAIEVDGMVHDMATILAVIKLAMPGSKSRESRFCASAPATFHARRIRLSNRSWRAALRAEFPSTSLRLVPLPVPGRRHKHLRTLRISAIHAP